MSIVVPGDDDTASKAESDETTALPEDAIDIEVEPIDETADESSNDSTSPLTGTAHLSRRGVLRGAGALATTGGVLSGTSGTALAQDSGLNVRTTNVEVLDQQQDTVKARTTGRVSGMSNYDCERCEVGAQVQKADGNSWHGGLQTVKHAPRDSFRVGVTIAISGLTPGRYKCRLCACPITRNRLFTANVIIIVLNTRDQHKDKKKHHKDKKKYHKDKKKKHHKDKKKKRYDKKKLKRAYHKPCPCRRDHGQWYHLMICGGGGRNVKRYAFRATTRDIRRISLSAAPSQFAHKHVTIDSEDAVKGRTVTGAVAGGGDAYVCRGEVSDIRVDNGARVYVNGLDVTDAISSGY